MGPLTLEEFKSGSRSRFEQKDLESYSLQRALRMFLPEGMPGHIKSDGLEWEVHRELEQGRPDALGVGHGGVYVPSNIPAPNLRAARRAAQLLGRAYPLDSATATEGSEFKFTSPGSFTDMLHQKLICGRLGAQLLQRLPGPVALPRRTSGSTSNWQPGESSPISNSMAAFDQVTLTPRTLIGTTGTTRQLVTVASEDFEALLAAEILSQHRVAIDTAAFVGTGASGQPTGIYVASGVQSHDVGPGADANAAPDYTDVTTMLGMVGDANADDGPVAFASTPLVATTLKRTLTFPAANAGAPIWEGDFLDGRVAGFPAAASNVLSKTLNNGVPGGGSEHGFVCGNFADLVIAEFGVFEIVVDPFSPKKTGVIELTSFLMVDVGLFHAASFVKGINAIP